MGNFARVDRPLLFLNLLLLFFIVSIPFATATLADYLTHGGADASLAAAIYQGVFLGMSLSFGALLWWAILRSYLKVPLSGASARLALVRFAGGIVVYGAAIGIAYLSAPASLLIDALLAVYYIFEQTPQSQSDQSESALSRTMRRDSKAVADDRDRRNARYLQARQRRRADREQAGGSSGRCQARRLGEERPGHRARESGGRLAGEEYGADSSEHGVGDQPLHGGRGGTQRPGRTAGIRSARRRQGAGCRAE